MIIGNGMMAKQFEQYQNNDNILIFVSGVSNSKETNLYAFERESKLLRKTIIAYPNHHFVYFSTSSMFDPMAKHSAYVEHKIEMERIIAQEVKSAYNIFRVSQVIGRANNHTLVNFLVEQIIHDREFDVWTRATRNLIAVEDIYQITNYILQHNLAENKIINIANSHNISVIDFLQIIEEVLGKKSKVRLVPKGFPFDYIDIEYIQPIIKRLNINFNSKDYYKDAIVRSFLKNSNS